MLVRFELQCHAQAVSNLAATALATARLPHHHVLKYSMSLATLVATVIAVAVAANWDTALVTSDC